MLEQGNLITTPLGNWNLFRIDFRCLDSKRQDLEKAWKGIEDEEEEGFEEDEGFEDDGGFNTTISKSLSIDLPLDDRLVFSSLDLTSLSLFSIAITSK